MIKPTLADLRFALDELYTYGDECQLLANVVDLLGDLTEFVINNHTNIEVKNEMDKKILAVKRSMDKKLSHLVALDKPRDKKLKACSRMGKKTAKKGKR
jgi:hypothetical protein